MTRTQLLGAASAVALACISHASFAQVAVTGGGSTLAQFDYIDEFSVFNAGHTSKQATFSTYWESGSGTGQQAFLNDDLSCDINKVQNLNGGACTGGANVGKPGNTVDYGASDATLSDAQIATYVSSSFGQSIAGNLIQLPSMGVGVSFPMNVGCAITGGVYGCTVTTNGQVTLTDSNLCEIFSGLATDYSQLGGSAGLPATGAFEVIYRSDGSGTTFLLTNHLNKVCNATNTKTGVSFTATTTFANLFPGGTPANFTGQKGTSGIANYQAGCTSGVRSNAISYLTPDFTTVDPASDGTLSCNVNGSNKSPLVVAAVLNGRNAILPTTVQIKAALSHAVSGQNLTPPTGNTGATNNYTIPADWVPLIQTVSAGYPVVGYTTFDFAQCYHDATVTAGIIGFLKNHYSLTQYLTIEGNNGFVPVANSGAAKFGVVIKKNVLVASSWNWNIGNTSVCGGLAGR